MTPEEVGDITSTGFQGNIGQQPPGAGGNPSKVGPSSTKVLPAIAAEAQLVGAGTWVKPTEERQRELVLPEILQILQHVYRLTANPSA